MARATWRALAGGEPGQRPEPLPFRRRALYAGLGLLPGVVFAAAVPFLAPVFPVTGPLYVAIVAYAALWLLWTVSELSYLAYAVRQFLAFRPGARWRGAVKYLGAAAVGLALGWAPTAFLGPVVEAEARLIENGARALSREPAFMNMVSPEGRWFVEFLAEARDVRALAPEFSDEVAEVLADNEEGRRVLERLKDRGGTLRMPRFFLSGQRHSSAFMSPLGDGVFFDHSHVTARGWTVEEFNADPAKRRQLARELKQLWLHELVHAEQSRRFYLHGFLPAFFPGQLAHFPHQVAAVPHIQLEYEAHIREQLAVHAWLQADPRDPHLSIGDYERFLDDLDAFLRDLDTSVTYKDFSTVDAAYYEDFLESVRSRWRALRVEGYMLLARRALPGDPAAALDYGLKAVKAAAEAGLPPPPSLLTPDPGPGASAPAR